MITLRNKIGQMLIMGFDGAEVDEKSDVSHWLSTDGLGGILLFDKDWATGKSGKNLVDREQIRNLLGKLIHFSQSFPLLTAIDYEGGYVDRLRFVPGCQETITPKAQGSLSSKDFDAAINQMAETLKDLGFNLNFAPVTDLSLDTEQGIIGKLNRCFSSDPAVVSECAKRFVTLFNEKGINCSYKHFPGHGSASGDTHTDFVDVTNTWTANELVPYKALADMKNAGVMVMTAHVINRNLDASGLPASLSKSMLTDLLRREIGFDGVIISDDLQMKAIADHFSMDEAMTLCVNAGADMMIFGNQLGFHTATELIDRMERLVQEGKISISRIEESFERIMRLKNR